MKFRRFLSLLCAAAMMVSVTGCGGSKDTANVDPADQTEAGAEADGREVTFPLKEAKNYSVFAILDGEYDLKDNVAMQKALSDANISFDYQSVMGADLSEKKNLVLASGEYPDVFYKANFSATELDKYGKQKILIPLEDMIRKYAPNLCALLDKVDGWDYITASDGHIYSLPEIDKEMPLLSPYWLNHRWLKNLGLEEPKNLDELYTVLKEFKEKDANGNGDANDEIPITGTDVVKPELLLPYFGVPYDAVTKSAVLDGKLTYIPTSDVYKEFVAYITKLYQEGLMDKNVFTQKHEQQGAIGQSGDVLGSFFDAGAFLTVGRDNDDDYAILTPFEVGIYPISSGITAGTLAITDACENPEVIIAWADQFYTEEGGILAWLGVEGETWKKDAEGNWEWIIGNGYGDDIAAVRSNGTIQGAAYHPSIQPEYWFSGMSEEVDPDEVYLNKERAKVTEMGAIPLPVMRYSDDDAKEISTLKADLDAYIDQYLAQVATGELELESSWEEYVTTINNMGGAKLTEIYQKAYTEAMAE
ncbi:type 2 periplasmic-binding domain-containing protein [Robinsoniella peoriensis]